MSKINHIEYAILKKLDNIWEWLARNNLYGGHLEAHTSEPLRMSDSHWSNGDMTRKIIEGDYLFQFIKWEDNKPYNIQELLYEYELDRDTTKEDVPVIPKVVAEWIEIYKAVTGSDATKFILNLLEDHPQSDKKFKEVQAYYKENPLKTIRAFVDGYIIEKAPQWYVTVKEPTNIMYVNSIRIYRDDDFDYDYTAWNTDALKFTDKKQAQALADFIGGEIKLVEE